MKNKRLAALGLTAMLSVSMPVLPVLAETSTAGEAVSTEAATEQETQEAEKPQETQGAEKPQEARETEKPQEAQGAEKPQETQGAEKPWKAKKCRKGSNSNDKQKVDEPENAIGEDAAKEKALSDAGVTAEQAGKIRAHISALDDGTVVYKVHFSYDGQEYSYQINALNGDLVKKSTEEERKE